MAYSPIAFIAPNYRDYAGYWFKAYTPATTTPKTIGLDAAGTIEVVKLQLNVDGFLVSAGGAIVMPFIDGSYDAYLFETEDLADDNDTASAVRVADDLIAVSASGNATNQFEVVTHAGATLLCGDDDYGKLYVLTSPTGCVVTLPFSATNDKGKSVFFMSDTIGGISFAAENISITLNTPLGLTLYTRYSIGFATALSETRWVLGGDLG